MSVHFPTEEKKKSFESLEIYTFRAIVKVVVYLK